MTDPEPQQSPALSASEDKEDGELEDEEPVEEPESLLPEFWLIGDKIIDSIFAWVTNQEIRDSMRFVHSKFHQLISGAPFHHVHAVEQLLKEKIKTREALLEILILHMGDWLLDGKLKTRNAKTVFEAFFTEIATMLKK